MKTKTKFIAAAVLLVLFAAFIIVIRTVDVAAIGPEQTSVGLSSLNASFSAAVGVNMTLYKIADILGYLALLVCVLFAGVGLWQIIRRRSLKNVDKTIYAVGALYVVTIALYAFFEKVIVNHRPVIMPGDEHVEASFPSSHTVLAIVVFGSAIMLAAMYLKNAVLRRALQALGAVLLCATVAARLFSGVHWATDIIGGIIIGSSLLFAASGLFDITAKKDGLANSHRHDK